MMDRKDFCRLEHNGEKPEIIPPQVFKDELKAISARREYVEIGPLKESNGQLEPTAALGLNGLAISGGGIRSATFSFGVMQALASKDVLKHMDYLSTVSGGGYSGSALTWALYGETENKKFEQFIDSFDVGLNFPIGTENPGEPGPAEPDMNRRALLRFLREHGKYLTPGGGIGLLSAIGVLLRGIIDNLLLWVALMTSMFLLVILNWGDGVFGNPSLFYYWVLIGIFNGAVYSLCTYGSFGLDDTYQYKLRRLYEKWIQPYLIVAIVLLLFGTIKLVSDQLSNWFQLLSPAMIISGVGMGLWTYFRSGSKDIEKRSLPLGLVATMGSVLCIYGTVLGAYMFADYLVVKEFSLIQTGIAVLALFIYGWFTNTNHLSLHRFYRDRLMETFLPEIGRAIEGKTGASIPADRGKISSMWNMEKPRGPYHIINTNMVLVDSNLLKQRARGGENFILSPFYCGSDSTAWRRTKLFENGNMTLATAMAISGAAANPNAGVGGKGLTRNRLVSLLMAMLNLRLGYWVRHPAKGRSWWWPPNHFHPGLYELYSGFKETKPWLQLSDGGHFENLALYELIRRRLKLIVVLDGGADPNFNFADLQTASRLVAEDFGTRINFSDSEDEGLNALVYHRDKKPGHFPSYPGRAKREFVTASIEYPEGESGKLIYVKTTMVEGLSVECQGYKDANPSFPDQSTADQFFDPEQFEAYRELGYVTGMKIAEEIRSSAEQP
jgi:hypothetical protein